MVQGYRHLGALTRCPYGGAVRAVERRRLVCQKSRSRRRGQDGGLGAPSSSPPCSPGWRWCCSPPVRSAAPAGRLARAAARPPSSRSSSHPGTTGATAPTSRGGDVPAPRATPAWTCSAVHLTRERPAAPGRALRSWDGLGSGRDRRSATLPHRGTRHRTGSARARAGACRPASGRGRRPGGARTRPPRDGAGSGTGPSASPRTTASATSAGFQQRPGGQHRGARRPCPSVMAVRTPCGHRHDTPTPASPQRMASHSARATVPCLVTE